MALPDSGALAEIRRSLTINLMGNPPAPDVISAETVDDL